MTVHTATESNDATSQDAAQTDTAADPPTEGNAAPGQGPIEPEARAAARRRPNWQRILAYGILSGLALTLAIADGTLKYLGSSASHDLRAEVESVQAAKDSTVAMLSYRPDTVEQNLSAARDRMTGAFRDSYASLTHDVVIPGAKQRQISAVATVSAVASVSATATHAVVLVFVNQTTIVGNDPPSSTASSVRVTLEKVQDRWLISQFDPV